MPAVVFDRWETPLGDRDGFGYGNGFFGGEGWVRLRDESTIAVNVSPGNTPHTGDGLSSGSTREILKVISTNNFNWPYLWITHTGRVYVKQTLNDATHYIGTVAPTTDAPGDYGVCVLPEGNGNTQILVGGMRSGGVWRVDLDVLSGSPTFTQETSHPTGGANGIACYNGRVFSVDRYENYPDGGRTRVYYGAVNDYSSSTWTADGSGNFDLPQSFQREPSWPNSGLPRQAGIVGTLTDGIYFKNDGAIYRLNRDPEIGSLSKVTEETFVGGFAAGDVLMGFTDRLAPAAFNGASVMPLSHLNLDDSRPPIYQQDVLRGAMSTDYKSAILTRGNDALVLNGGMWSKCRLSLGDNDSPGTTAVCANKDGDGVIVCSKGSGGIFFRDYKFPDVNAGIVEADILGRGGKAVPTGNELRLPLISDPNGMVVVREVHIDGYFADSTLRTSSDLVCVVRIQPQFSTRADPGAVTQEIREADLGLSHSPSLATIHYPFRVTVRAHKLAYHSAAAKVSITGATSMALGRITVVYDVEPYLAAS